MARGACGPGLRQGIPLQGRRQSFRGRRSPLFGPSGGEAAGWTAPAAPGCRPRGSPPAEPGA
eukprot:1370099-Prymnesium_polylepis.1